MISPEHQHAIQDAIPAGVEVPAEFWRDLDTAINLYRIQQERRAAKPPRSEQKRWQRIEDLVDKLAAELRAARMGISWEHGDPLWPNRAIEALWGIKQQANANREGHEALGFGFERRANPHRARLCDAICDLWSIHLKQKLTYSMRSNGVPRGPAIEFVEACLEPVLGAVSPHIIRGAIDRAQDQRLKADTDRVKRQLKADTDRVKRR
jgi:hypothetical protein